MKIRILPLMMIPLFGCLTPEIKVAPPSPDSVLTSPRPGTTNPPNPENPPSPETNDPNSAIFEMQLATVEEGSNEIYEFSSEINGDNPEQMVGFIRAQTDGVLRLSLEVLDRFVPVYSIAIDANMTLSGRAITVEPKTFTEKIVGKGGNPPIVSLRTLVDPKTQARQSLAQLVTQPHRLVRKYTASDFWLPFDPTIRWESKGNVKELAFKWNRASDIEYRFRLFDTEEFALDAGSAVVNPTPIKTLRNGKGAGAIYLFEDFRNRLTGRTDDDTIYYLPEVRFVASGKKKQIQLSAQQAETVLHDIARDRIPKGRILPLGGMESVDVILREHAQPDQILARRPFSNEMTVDFDVPEERVQAFVKILFVGKGPLPRFAVSYPVTLNAE